MSALRTLLGPALLALVVVPARAESKAHATLYTRVEGSEVRAAIRIEINPGWHLYGEDTGPEDAGGLPTTVSLAADGVTWDAAEFPAAEKHDNVLGSWNWIYQGELVIRARGTIAAGATPGPATAKLSGLTCEDEGVCLPYGETVQSSGRGPDELFAAFSRAPRGGKSSAQSEAHAKLYTRVVGGEVRAAIAIDIEPGWHLYGEDAGPEDAGGLPTTVALAAEGVTWDAAVFPEAEKHDNAFGSWNWIHRGELVIRARGKLAAGATPGAVSAALKGLTCEDKAAGVCLPYGETVESSGTGPDGLFAAFDAGLGGDAPRDGSAKHPTAETPRPGTTGRSADASVERGVLLFLLQAIGWGLFALLMPCTYPMIPITISFFTKQADARGGSALPLALAYGAGIVLVFILVGVVFGSVIIPFAAHPLTNLVIGGAFVLFALALFGAIDLQPPRFLMNAAGRASGVGGYAGVFLMGTTLVVTSFTCTAPFVGALLASTSQAGSLGRTVLGMGVFGLTMAVPFALLALLPARVKALPRSGEWMHTLKVFFGFVELAAALKFVSNVDLVWGWGFLSRELFFALWFGVFLAAALYLFALVRLKGEEAEIGPGRLTGGVATLLLALYFGYGALGRELDWISDAIAPAYHDQALGADVGPSGATAVAAQAIVVDDYDAALQRARADGKLLLANFTGHTCTNCRYMETKMFPRTAVAAELKRYVEARLHTDGQTNIDRILELQAELTGTKANPVYVLVDPKTGKPFGKFEGATFDEQEFVEFLRTRALE